MHTAQVSPCGKVSARDAVAQYRGAGFDAVIVTDHMREDILTRYGDCWSRQVDEWLSGYKSARQAGEAIGLTVWLGVEITFPDTREDYLLYGIDESFLYRNPSLAVMGLPALSRLARSENILLVQAHPFRPYGEAAPARYLDGMEVRNGNPRQQNNNETALEYCRLHRLIETGGSDYHQVMDLSVGMEFDSPLESVAAFAEALRRGEGRVVDVPAAPGASSATS
ncbi:MAG: transposase [Clostridiales bacterium]|nr:transposase [Clostridiales bacterium]